MCSKYSVHAVVFWFTEIDESCECYVFVHRMNAFEEIGTVADAAL